jgi:hypothetical protein
MAYRYTREVWEQIKAQREEERRDLARAIAEDMDAYSALREEQHRDSSYDLERLSAAKGL